MDTLDRIGRIGLIPVVVMEDAADAVPTAKALTEAGIETMEITMRTEAGLDAIRRVHEAFPDMLVGAGTILSVEKCQEAIEVGSRFIVTPGFNREVVEYCLEKRIPITPGCVTPTEIECALSYGINIVKYFPASVYGGVKGCGALFGPYRSVGVKFVPTGGINQSNLAEYADKKFIHAVGGGWLCMERDLLAGDFASITQTASQSIDILLGMEAIAGDEEGLAGSALGLRDLVYHYRTKTTSRSSDLPLKIRTNSIDRTLFYLSKAIPEWEVSQVESIEGRTFAMDLMHDGQICLSLQEK